MKLPYLENAVIAEAKVKDYLLSETHEDGKSKAAFFMRFGFLASQWERLADALRQHIQENEVAGTLTTTRGVHYTIEGPLQTPTAETPLVRSV